MTTSGFQCARRRDAHLDSLLKKTASCTLCTDTDCPAVDVYLFLSQKMLHAHLLLGYDFPPMWAQMCLFIFFKCKPVVAHAAMIFISPRHGHEYVCLDIFCLKTACCTLHSDMVSPRYGHGHVCLDALVV